MADKIESEMEVSDTKTAEVKEVKNNESTEAQKNLTIHDRIKNLFNFFTVEPFLVCYILPAMISTLALQKLNLEKACRTDLNYTEEICSMVISANGSDNITEEASVAAQIMIADLTAWTQPLQSGIPALLILFFGTWSDKTGNRKALMLFPILGEIVSSIGLLLTTYFFLEWPLWVTGLIQALPSALTGGLSVALMGCYSYIADVTTIETRTFRVGIIAVIATLAVPIGVAISGILTQAVGYYGIFSIAIALYSFGFVNTYLRVQDVRSTKMEGTFFQKFVDFFHPKHIWATISVLFMSRGKKLLKLILVLFSYIVILGPVSGEAQVLFLYAINTFKMDLIEFSKFTTYSILIGIVGTIIAVSLFSKKLKMHDALLGIIATTSKVSSSFVYAFASSIGWLYAAPAVDIFGSSAAVAIKSLGTKIVEPEEVGKMCSLIGLAEALVPVIYTPLYTKVYANTLTSFPGCFYLLGGLMTIPAFFTFIFIYVLYKKEAKDIVKNPAEKEAYAHDNAVTVL